MGKPIEHAISSAKKFGGVHEDYLPIHEFLDSSKGAFGDLRHRALTHNSWFLTVVLPRVFGPYINIRLRTGGMKPVSVQDIGEWHVIEDFRGKFIPSASDYLQELELKPWMDNGEGDPPPSRKKVKESPLPAPSAVEHVMKLMEDAEKSHPPANPFWRKGGCGAGMLD